MSREAESARRTNCSLAILSVIAVGMIVQPAWSADVAGQIADREAAGDLAGARALLEQQAKVSNSNGGALAEFLARHRAPDSREAYLKWIELEKDPTRRKAALRELSILDFEQGKDTELANDIRQYQDAGGTDLSPA